MILPKQTKWWKAKSGKATSTRRKLPQKKATNEEKHENFRLKKEYDVDIDNCRPEKLDKVLQKFWLRWRLVQFWPILISILNI